MKTGKKKILIQRGEWEIFLIPSFIFLLILGFSPGLNSYASYFGYEACANHDNENTNYATAVRIQCPENGTSSRLEIKSAGAGEMGTFRMAVYDDSVYSSSGQPNHKLWEGTDISYTGSQWLGENVNTIQLTQNAYYWFAVKVSLSEDLCYDACATNAHEWKNSQPYANAFPNPWGSYSGRNSWCRTMRMHYTTPTGGTGIIEIDPGIIEGGK